MTIIVAALLLSAFIAPSPVLDPDPCRLLTASEIRSALGSAPSGGEPVGPEIDEEMAAKSWACDQQLGKQLLSISVLEFASTAAAANGMTVIRKASESPDVLKLTEAPGLGARALWGSEEGGAVWVAHQGRYILNLTFAGDMADPAGLREPLRRLAVLALGRL